MGTHRLSLKSRWYRSDLTFSLLPLLTHRLTRSFLVTDPLRSFFPNRRAFLSSDHPHTPSTHQRVTQVEKRPVVHRSRTLFVAAAFNSSAGSSNHLAKRQQCCPSWF